MQVLVQKRHSPTSGKGMEIDQMNEATSKLTAKQQWFVDEYLIDLNATQAAIRAGYSEKTAVVTGCKNLIKANVAKAVAEAKKTRVERKKSTPIMCCKGMSKSIKWTCWISSKMTVESRR